MKKYVIGSKNIGYNQSRNYYGTDLGQFEYKKIHDLTKLIEYPYFKLFNKNLVEYQNSFFNLGLNRVDLLHFFDTINCSAHKWVVAFESLMPRYNDKLF